MAILLFGHVFPSPHTIKGPFVHVLLAFVTWNGFPFVWACPIALVKSALACHPVVAQQRTTMQ